MVLVEAHLSWRQRADWLV